MKCLNCESDINTTDVFCSNCGQKINDKLTLGILFRNTIGNYFSFDSKFFHSIIPLLFRPGFLATKYIEGKRTRYMHPAQFYLFFSILFFFLFSFITQQSELTADMAIQKGFDAPTIADTIISDVLGSDSLTVDDINLDTLKADLIELKNDSLINSTQSSFDLSSDNPSSNSGIMNIFENANFNSQQLDSLIKNNGSEKEKLKAAGYIEGDSKFDKFLAQKIIRFQTKKGSGLLETLYSSIPFTLFLLLPLFALLLKLFYYKKGPISHHLVYSFYFFVFVFAILSFFLIVKFSLDISYSFFLTIPIILFVYLWLGNYKFYKTGIIGSFFKTIFLLFMTGLFISPITVLFALLLSLLTY